MPRVFKQVKRNKGVAGIDQMGVGSFLGWYKEHGEEMMTQILKREYRPQAVRSAQQALEKANRDVSDGRMIVVDMDLNRFFDEVNRGRLMSYLSEKIGDKNVLKLTRRYLQSGIMTARE